jgi:hypothetical protein
MSTQIARLGNTVVARDLRAMFSVTGDTMQCVYIFQTVRIARIPELAHRM